MLKWAQRLLAESPKDRSSELRTVRVDDRLDQRKFCDNRIYGAKYNIFTFLPLNLWDQFHRPINIYFLVTAALQFVPSVAAVSPLTTIFPISVAFLINAAKEGVDDLRRHRQDAEINERIYQRVRPGTLEVEEVASADIQVGDVLILRAFEVVPSDVVILLTSHENGGAYITTESLDGETGSKQRFALLHHIFKYASSTSSAAHDVAARRLPNAEVGSSSSSSGGGAVGVSAREGRRCCDTTEEHQAHCLRFIYSSHVVLNSEGPNAHLHSYHGAAAVRVPMGVARNQDAASSAAATPLPIGAKNALLLSPTDRRTPHATTDDFFHADTDERSGLLGLRRLSGVGGDHRGSSVETDEGLPAAFDGHEQSLPVNINNVIYASSRTGNTHFIVALVVFTGQETKANMTRDAPPTKWATIDHLFNYLSIFIFFVQFVLVAVCAIVSSIRLKAHASLWYLGGTAEPIKASEYFPILPLRYLMMLSPMVPLSFKVMVEISKAYVSNVIRWDEDMRTDEEPASVNNSALAEELGQVEYVLSDKTGTLTANIMTFSALATASDEVYAAATDDSLGDGPDQRRPLADVGQSIKASAASGRLEDWYLMLTMVFCNTIERTLPLRLRSCSCSVSVGEAAAGGGGADGGGVSGRYGTRSGGASFDALVSSRWMSSSPDEVALVEGAEQCGFSLRHRTRTHATVDLWGEAGTSLEAEVVHTLPFSSDRGMMSVLLRCPTVSVSPSSAAADEDRECEDAAAPDDASPMRYVLLTKGADEKVLPRCTDAYSTSHLGSIRSRLARFSRQGLRTLVYGYRVMSDEEAHEALRRSTAVETSFASVAVRDGELQCIYAQLEQGLTYCGITAVKDELQDEVAQTLAQLRHANIRVWMLTGDKTETAKQTAVACGLLTSADRVVTLTPANEDLLTPTEHLAYVADKLREIMDSVAREGGPAATPAVTRWQKARGWCRRFFWQSSGLEDFVHEFTQPPTCECVRPVDHPLATHPLSVVQARYGAVSQAVVDMVPTVCGGLRRRPGPDVSSTVPASPGVVNTCDPHRGYCVAISGKTLRLLENEDATSHGHSAVVQRFHKCLLQARSVVCSRTSPALKSYVVDMVRRSGHITLAVGDGGNDVPMLQAAHVGVGIKGREGSQAKLASDFAIGQFRFLSKLILVHGHTAYQRTAMIVQQSFWKTVLIAWVQVLFNISTDFSAVSYWDSLSLTLYNAIPTVPVTFLCVMDMPLSPWLLRSTPQLYSMSQRGRYLNATTFYGYVARAFLHGTIIYYLAVGLRCGAGAIMQHGWVLDRNGDFYAPYFAVVTVHTYTVLTESHCITMAHWCCFLFSVWTCFLSFWLYARVPTSPNDTFSALLKSPAFYLSYLGLLTAVCASLAIYAIPKVLWFPDALQFERLLLVHLRERQKTWQRSLPMRVLRSFFQEDNPSNFWKSTSPFHALRYSPPPRRTFTVNGEGEDDDNGEVVIHTA